MATFGVWLTGQKHRSDAVGELSRLWVAAEGDRPKVHSPSGIDRWFEKQPQYEQTHGWMELAVREYQAAPRSLQAVPDGQQPLPFGPQMTPSGSVNVIRSGQEGQILAAAGPVDWAVEIRMRLADLAGKVDTIMAALGIEMTDPEPAAGGHFGQTRELAQATAEASWDQLAAMADYTDEEAQ